MFRITDFAFSAKNPPRGRFRWILFQIAGGFAALALLTLLCFRLGASATTVACLYFVVVVLVSLQGNFLSSLIVSIAAVICLDYFFTAPLFSLQIQDLGNGVELVTFLITSAVVTNLVSRLRSLMQERLRQSEAYLAEAQRLSHTGSFGWKVSTGEFAWSDESLRIFEFKENKLPGAELIHQRTHPEDLELVKETLERAAQDGKDFDFEHRLLVPNGTVKHVHVVAHAENAERGKFEFVGAMMDITERRKAEDELRRTQADLEHASRVTTMGQLTAALAHEVNQPIAAAVTNANACIRWLGASTPNVAEARAAAMRIVKDGTRAADIISRARLLFKKGTPERTLLDINEVIREMIPMLRGEAARHEVSVWTDLAPGLPHVAGDRVQLQQVLMNLMLNGIDAMKDIEGPRELLIKSDRGEEEQVLVSVSDTGVGLPPEQADKIFSPFFTTKASGTGMGLSISRSIAESHGGKLWAGGNTPRGAIFFLTLPTKIEALD